MYDRASLRTQFKEVYPEAQEPCVCRAPGRVNLIGEHTDYNGLPVLPMTIGQDIRIAFASRADGRVRICDTDQRFPVAEFANGFQIEPSQQGAWENYAKAAISGINGHVKSARLPGMDMLVCGTVPISAGLSSSSALVVACALAYLRVLEKELERDISRLALAELMAEAEHYVGTRGGGMDQAVILLGQENAACKIDFHPLHVENVPLFDDHVFVVCNSLVTASKTGEMLHKYNAGPRLCRLICALVQREAQEEFGDEIRLARLGDLVRGHLCLTDKEVGELFERVLSAERMPLADAARRLKVTPEKIRTLWLGDLREPEGGFGLKARAHHQLTEYQRVEAARDALLAGDAARLGSLMNASHESCAKNYEISCPELEMLVGIARKAGALGSRLTGAGFGGCTVNLLARKDLQRFRETVCRAYYLDYLHLAKDYDLGNAVFVATASSGAGYL